MTQVKYLFLSLLLVLSASSLFARRVFSTKTVEAPAVDKTVVALGDDYRDIKQLVEKARREADALRRKAERDMQEVSNRVKRRKTRLERRREEALRKDEERFEQTQERAQDEVDRIRKDAEREALKLMHAAEVRALDLRDKLDAQDKKDRKDGVVAITQEWRTNVIEDFKKDTDFIKDVIVRGEVSRRERENFVALFEEQLTWLRGKVNEVVNFFDEHYKVVIAKKNALNVLVDAQRQADEIIADISLASHLAVTVSDQIRALALYEINNHLRTSKTSDVYMSIDVITKLVKRVSQMVSPDKRALKIVSEKDTISTLKQRVAELESKLDGSAGHVAKVKKRAKEMVDAQKRYVDKARTFVHKAKEEKVNLIEKVRKEVDQEQKQTINRLKKKSDVMARQMEISDEEAHELKEMLTQLHGHVAHLKQQHRVEKQRMEFAVQHKEEERASLEESLVKVNNQIALLQGRTAQQLASLGEHITGQQVREGEIVSILERKNREKSDLELSLAQINGQLDAVEAHADESSKAAESLAKDLSQQRGENMDLNAALAKITELLSHSGVSLSAAPGERLTPGHTAKHGHGAHDHVHEPDDDGAEFEMVEEHDQGVNEESEQEGEDDTSDGSDDEVDLEELMQELEGSSGEADADDEAPEEGDPFELMQETVAFVDDDADDDDDEEAEESEEDDDAGYPAFDAFEDMSL